MYISKTNPMDKPIRKAIPSKLAHPTIQFDVNTEPGTRNCFSSAVAGMLGIQTRDLQQRFWWIDSINGIPPDEVCGSMEKIGFLNPTATYFYANHPNFIFQYLNQNIPLYHERSFLIHNCPTSDAPSGHIVLVNIFRNDFFEYSFEEVDYQTSSIYEGLYTFPPEFCIIKWDPKPKSPEVKEFRDTGFTAWARSSVGQLFLVAVLIALISYICATQYPYNNFTAHPFGFEHTQDPELGSLRSSFSQLCVSC